MSIVNCLIFSFPLKVTNLNVHLIIPFLTKHVTSLYPNNPFGLHHIPRSLQIQKASPGIFGQKFTSVWPPLEDQFYFFS